MSVTIGGVRMGPCGLGGCCGANGGDWVMSMGLGVIG